MRDVLDVDGDEGLIAELTAMVEARARRGEMRRKKAAFAVGTDRRAPTFRAPTSTGSVVRYDDPSIAAS